MPTLSTSWKEIRDGAKKSIIERKVSPSLTNGILKWFALLWKLLKRTFLVVFFSIFTQLKKILPLP